MRRVKPPSKRLADGAAGSSRNKQLVRKFKREIDNLGKLQDILRAKDPYYDFLEPLVGNARATLVDLLCYLEEKNPYYTGFNEPFFRNRQAAMHRMFFSDLHVATEDGLRKLIEENDFEVKINRQLQARSIVDKIKSKLQDSSQIVSELRTIIRLVGDHPTFNDYLNSVLSSIYALDEAYKSECRIYFDAINIIRNKVSHSDMSLSEKEKSKLIQAKFREAISNDGKLQMTFEGYRHLIVDVIRFFDMVHAHLEL